MKYEDMREKVDSVVESERDKLYEVNKWIFNHPELSGKEFETSKKWAEFLKGEGYEVQYPYGGFETAFFARKPLAGGREGKYKFAIMVEYDALPEVGHACGHSLSGAISVLAGMALEPICEELDLEVHIIGTPAEEADGAKGYMVDKGMFHGYDMAMMVHLNNYNMIAPDVKALSTYLFTFRGKAAHAGAAPWEGSNALSAGQLFFHACDMLRQHSRPECRIHGIFRNGGTNAGTVPDEASVEMWIRSDDKKTHTELDRKLEDCAKGAAIATQCTYEKVLIEHTYDPMKKNPAGQEVLKEIYGELGLPLNAPDNIFGSSDAGNVSQVVPTFHPLLELSPHDVVVHQKEFADCVVSDRAYQALAEGAKIIAYQALKVFSSPDTLAAIKADFKK